MTTLRDVPAGQYRFLPGIAPYSSGVAAMPGHQIVYVTLAAPVAWREGFARIDAHLAAEGRPRATLCAVALRSPAPFTFDGFDAFNAGYRALLEQWGLLVAGDNPIARTNVVPLVGAPPAPSLYAFAYTVPGRSARPTFVAAGSGELRAGTHGPEGIVRRGDTSADALREKAAYVMSVMQGRLAALGGAWSDVTTIDVYTAHPIEAFLADTVLRPAGAAAVHGVRWFPSRPPIQGLEYEMDLRGVASELVL